MPNHVHAVFAPLLTEAAAILLADEAIHSGKADANRQFVLSKIMQSMKGWTARECNRILAREGTFWQRESFDHIVRNPDEWARIVRYVVENPVKAGLVDRWDQWPWSYRRDLPAGEHEPGIGAAE